MGAYHSTEDNESIKNAASVNNTNNTNNAEVNNTSEYDSYDYDSEYDAIYRYVLGDDTNNNNTYETEDTNIIQPNDDITFVRMKSNDRLSKAELQIALLKQLLENSEHKCREMEDVIVNHEKTIYKQKKEINTLNEKVGALGIVVDEACDFIKAKNNISNSTSDNTSDNTVDNPLTMHDVYDVHFC